MTYSVQTMPYPDGLVRTLLDADTDSGVQVFTEFPVDILSRMPCVIVHCYGGLDLIDPRFAIQPTIQVDSIAVDRRAAAALAGTCHRSLLNAWLNARRVTGTDAGVISRVTVLAHPARLATVADPSGYARWTARYLLTLRP